MSSIVGAAVSLFIGTWLATTFGVGEVGVYLLIAGSLTSIAVLVMCETKDASLDSVKNPRPVHPAVGRPA